MPTVATRLPEWLKRPLRPLRQLARDAAYHGSGRDCPVCGKSSKRFAAFGETRRPDARCMRCGALERHRLVWSYWTRRTDLFDGRRKRMLHLAPEEIFQARLRRRLGGGYVAADLCSPRAGLRLDVAALPCPDACFDVIHCSHVLEHVPDDRRAMAELHRVLAPGGWALLLVPITAERTLEDPSVTDPEERRRLFGQHDHLRRYGPDCAERLREAGFAVQAIVPADFLGADEVRRLGLAEAGVTLYRCSRRAA